MRPASRTFSAEFKQEAVRLLETSSKSGTVVARELGISDTLLYRWRKELRANGKEAGASDRTRSRGQTAHGL